MADAPRIDELRRRLQKDPASFVFAQLAEEHRRAGDVEAAIQICRSGLAVHPGYTSARVTLGRALIAAGRLDAAAEELQQVLRMAPDNLAAARALEEIAARRRPAPARPLAELERGRAHIQADRDRRRATAGASRAGR